MGDYVRPGGQVVSYVNVSVVRPEDGGQYSCSAENGAGRVTHAAIIQVVGPPFVRPMENVTSVAGDTLEVTCTVGGHPIESIWWEKGSSRLPLNHRQKVFENGTLQVRNVDKISDSGFYTCVATNAGGRTARNSLFVTILVRPQIDPFTFPKSLQQGQRYSVLCNVLQGDPPIRIRWTKDGSLSLPIEYLNVRVASLTAYSSSLLFDSLSPEQRGNYTCIAENSAGRASHSASMVIYVPPYWRAEPNDISALRGRPAAVDCQADGFPTPRIRWTKAEGPSGEFRGISSHSRLQVFANGSLVVQDIRTEDTGRYLCQASNGVGQELSKVIHLTVNVAAHFKAKFRAVSVRKWEDAQLACEAEGDQPIHVIWMKDKQALEPDLRYNVKENAFEEGTTTSLLTVRRVDRRDSALYTCVATNTYGQDDTNMQLIVQESPDAPQDARLLETTSRSAEVCWTASYSGNSPVTQYWLIYQEEGATREQQVRNMTVPSSKSCAVLRELAPNIPYQVQVYAENALGRSEPSNLLQMTTEPEAPGGPPLKVTALATGVHTLKVTWKPPRQDLQYGILEGYYVGYRQPGSEEAFVYKTLQAESPGDAATEETELSGLKRLSEYAVVVQAYNAKGAGPPSDPVMVKTLENDPPGSLALRVTFTNVTSIGLNWEKTDTENAIEGYVVHHQRELGEWQETELTAADTEVVLHDLKCGSRYHFYISAFNAVGKGPPSEVIRAKTHGRAPIAPGKQFFVSVNQSCASLHLGAWLDGGCPIHEFVVRHRQQKHPNWVVSRMSRQFFTLENLTPATWYRLLVTAYNEAGSTDAEYSFLTSPLHYMSEVSPTSLPDDFVSLWYLKAQILVPALVSFTVVMTLVALVCIVMHRKPSSHHSTQMDPPDDCYYNSRKCPSESVSLSEKSSLKKAPRSPYYPTLYTTTRISAPEQPNKTLVRQVLEESPNSTVMRTPRTTQSSDCHIYHYPEEMSESVLQGSGKRAGEMGEELSSSVFWKEVPEPETKDPFLHRSPERLQDHGHFSGSQRMLHRFS